MSYNMEQSYRTDLPGSDRPVKGFVDFMVDAGREIEDCMNVYELHYDVEDLSVIVDNGSPEQLAAFNNVYRVGIDHLTKMSSQINGCSADNIWVSKEKEWRHGEIDYLDPVVSVEDRGSDFSLEVRGEGLSYPNKSIVDRIFSDPSEENEYSVRIEVSDSERRGWKEVVRSLELEPV
ncbi:MAG: hypothetical protein H8Z69_04470 [Nanohaloarchaea archaeon]|nr:hypothetical protein [Candidatus Nanohaloarchaea archaeon]